MFSRTPPILKIPSPTFAGLPAAELEILDHNSTMLSMGPGRVVLQQGDPGREVFVVLSGEVQVKRDGAHVARLGTGAVVGELALLHNEPRNATIRTTTETAVLVLNRRELATVMARCPTFAARMSTEAESRMLDAAA